MRVYMEPAQLRQTVSPDGLAPSVGGVAERVHARATGLAGLVFVAEQNRAVLPAGLADTIAKLDEVVVDIDHRPFDGASGAFVVSAFIEGDPSPAKLVLTADVIPSHTWHVEGLLHRDRSQRAFCC
jgi:hypothetical protein